MYARACARRVRVREHVGAVFCDAGSLNGLDWIRVGLVELDLD